MSANNKIVDVNAIPEGWMGLDIGPKTIEELKVALSDCKVNTTTTTTTQHNTTRQRSMHHCHDFAVTTIAAITPLNASHN